VHWHAVLRSIHPALHNEDVVMERNTSDDIGSSGASGLGAGTDSLSVTGEGSGQNPVTGAYDTTAGSGTDTSADASQSRLGAAQEKLGQAKDAATEKLGQAREKATALKATLADKLEAGASTLRERAQPGTGTAQLAGAAAGANGATGGLLDNEQVQRFAGPAADAMERTADFLRNGDVREALEEQVRTNPGRTLLIALGLGYVLGKTLRR
jgi:hypothetical protein